MVISDAYWRRAFGADPKVLGTKIRLDGDLYTVAGVMPPGFRHPGRTLGADVDLWATTGFAAPPFPAPVVRAVRILPGVMGRLKTGLTVGDSEVSSEQIIACGLATMHPEPHPVQP